MNLQGSIRIPRRPKDGAPGAPGAPGRPGQIPIQKEWVVGDVHRNTDEIVDYIYVRGTNANSSYWYKLTTVGTREAGSAPSGGESRAGYERVDWLKELAVQVLIAEEANLAGFIFKEGQLISVRGTVDGVAADYSGQANFVPNLILNGAEGDVKITGTVNANSGSIGGLTIEDGKLLVGDLNGDRIELDPYTRRIRLINDADQLMGRIVFASGDTQRSVGAIIELNYLYQNVRRSSIRLGGFDSDVTIRTYNSSGVEIGETNYRHDGMYVDGQKVDMDGGYAHPSTHPASMITAGTFPGIVKANNNTSYTTKQVRNMILSTGDAVSSQMANGDIWIKYE